LSIRQSAEFTAEVAEPWLTILMTHKDEAVEIFFRGLIYEVTSFNFAESLSKLVERFRKYDFLLHININELPGLGFLKKETK